MRRDAPRRLRPGRRGVTLVEMLVTVALVLLIMVIVVSVFRSATGAMRGSQVTFDLDQTLRRLDATIRQDLTGATARFTPPLNPRMNLGYFEYGENAGSDAQGEDSDDWMALTVKAPEGQPFTGRCWVPIATTVPATQSPRILEPVTITSDYAEVLYFLRNGNLYRRVLLIVPGRASVMAQGSTSAFNPSMLGGTAVNVGWMGVNNISARPADRLNVTGTPPLPNTLGDLTNRENRIFRPRFSPDYITNNATTVTRTPDGLPDDANNNGIPDFYPTLYPNAVATSLGALANRFPINETAPPTTPTRAHPTSGNLEVDMMPFPFIFPGAYSKSDVVLNATPAAYGAIHGLMPLNHNPLELGDNLPVPTATQHQTYWGWPTWKETLSLAWTDPWKPVNTNSRQGSGLSWVAPTFLPPMTNDVLQVVNDPAFTPATYTSASGTPFRLTAQPFAEALTDTTNVASSKFALQVLAPQDQLWKNAWEDDLIMTGVRSFDIKAYDPNAAAAGSAPGYYDLGYNAYNAAGTAVWLGGFPAPASGNAYPYAVSDYAQAAPLLQSFGHEGRIPPLILDMRLDPQYPTVGQDPRYPTLSNVPRNIGEDPAAAGSANTVRLRRVWDTWSTEYTNAPDLPLDPTQGPLNGLPPVYPSYPPPYPAPLRGIQIQIRLTNQPDSDRIKTLTIRQDFTDKL